MHNRLFMLSMMALLGAQGATALADEASCVDWAAPSEDYRTPVTVTEKSGSALSDYSIKITLDTASLISAGKMRNDAGDLRFYSQENTPLGYWIESGINTSATVVWVKIPSLAANTSTTLYAYYGDASLTSQSSPISAFLEADDFESYAVGAVPGGKWTVRVGSVTVQSHGGDQALRIQSTSYPGHLSYANTPRDQYIVQVELSDEAGGSTNDPHPGLIFAWQDANNYDGIYMREGTNELVWGRIRNGSWSPAQVVSYDFNASQYYLFEARVSGTSVSAYVNGVKKMDLTGTLAGTGKGTGLFHFSTATTSYGFQDNFRILAYASVAPELVLGSQQVRDCDSDGYTEQQGDCNEFNPGINPGAAEICGDNIDQNCDQADLSCLDVDHDLDGYTENEGDCDDDNGDISPDATEICDEIDNNCDGNIDEDVTTTWYEDVDGDGVGDSTSTLEACEAPAGYVPTGGDPDDGDPDTYPGAPEICDGKDNDVDDQIDEGVLITVYADTDGDTFGDGSAPSQVCQPGVNQSLNSLDCNDAQANINPGAAELCNNLDDDCDGVVDEGVLTTVYVDNDGDTFGDPATSSQACSAGAGQSGQAGDCDDDSATTYPNAAEIPYDGVDNNCDGSDLTDVDEDGVESTEVGGEDCDDSDDSVYPQAQEIPYDGVDQDCDGQDLVDVDDDGFIATEAEGNDCDDDDPNTYPGATEFGDGQDNDCDGLTDEGLDTTDDDQDGFSEANGDCNDNNAAIHPEAAEICNDIDDNCDGVTDDGFDADEDDHLNEAQCEEGVGDDCDDQDSTVYPGAIEVVDGVDNDCDGIVDEGTSNYDDDGDTFTEEGGDCNDDNDQIFPGAEEILDGLDNNCDGQIDEGIEQDNDGDGFSEGQGDCNDSDPQAYPGAPEVEDGVDNNCDGTIDEGFEGTPTPGEETATPDGSPTAELSPTPIDSPTEVPSPTLDGTESPTDNHTTPTDNPPTDTPSTDTPATPTPGGETTTPAGETPSTNAHGGGCGCDNNGGESTLSWMLMGMMWVLGRRGKSSGLQFRR